MSGRNLLIFLFSIISLSGYGQKRKLPKQELVIVSGNLLDRADSSKVLQLYYDGLREKVVQNTTLAIESFQQVLKIDPLHHPSYYELAQIYLKKGDFANAKTYGQKAVTIETGNEWYWLLVSNIYQHQQDYALLDYALTELVKLVPDKPEYSFDKANALFMMGKPDEALALYDELQKKFGLTEELLQGRQRIYLKKGDMERAASDLELLIKENPNEVRYYLSLGDLYYANQKQLQALAVYQQAKKLDESNPFTRMAIAQILESQKQPEAAFEELKAAFQHPDFKIDQKVKIVIKYFELFPNPDALKKAEELSKIITIAHPNDPKGFSLYGDVLYQKEDFLSAKAAYHKALKLNKGVFAVWEQLLRINLFTNDIPALLKDGEEAITLFPNQYVLYFYVGMAYLYEKNYDKAVSYLNNTLSYDIENKNLKVQVLSSLGDAYQGQKKYKESANAYEEALLLEPTNSYTLNNYAYYLSLRKEDLAKAERMSARSNELEKNNASFQDTYAWILFNLGKYDEAKMWMLRAIANNPSSAVQFEHLGDIYFKLGDLNQALQNWNKALQINSDNPLLKKKINEKKYLE